MTTIESLESRIRKTRTAMFTLSPHDQEMAGASIDRLKLQLAAAKQKPATGVYSGLTRDELSKSRTCEADWF